MKKITLFLFVCTALTSRSQSVVITELGSAIVISGTEVQLDAMHAASITLNFLIHNTSLSTQTFGLERFGFDPVPRWREAFYVFNDSDTSTTTGWELFGGTGISGSTSNPYNIGGYSFR